MIDPATGQVVGEYPTATDDQIDRALAAAAEAHCKWSRVSTTAVRAALEGAVSALHTERRDELAGIIRREMGKPLDQALGEIDAVRDLPPATSERAMSSLPTSQST